MTSELRNRIARIRKEFKITGKNWKERRINLEVKEIVMNMCPEDADENNIRKIYNDLILRYAVDTVNRNVKK